MMLLVTPPPQLEFHNCKRKIITDLETINLNNSQLEHICSSSVRIQDVALKTCQKRLTVGRSGERGSRISMPAARHGDDDDFNKENTFSFLIEEI